MDNSEAVTLGPLSFTPQQVFVSVASSLISLPVSILIVFLFRKAGPKPVKPKRNVETGALEYDRYHDSEPLLIVLPRLLVTIQYGCLFIYYFIRHLINVTHWKIQGGGARDHLCTTIIMRF